MIKTIREIGLFMIAAQAVVHFAPGRQYEKYIKSIAGVIILVLFLKPIFMLVGGQWEKPEDILQRVAEVTEMPAFPEMGQIIGAGDTAMARIEEEIRALLNQSLQEDAFYVRRVSVQPREEAPQELEPQSPLVEVELVKKQESQRIVVEEIQLGEMEDVEKKEIVQAYRRKFAELLEIPEENVEVRMDGREG